MMLNTRSTELISRVSTVLLHNWQMYQTYSGNETANNSTSLHIHSLTLLQPVVQIAVHGCLVVAIHSQSVVAKAVWHFTRPDATWSSETSARAENLAVIIG
jgi:hypothetical protein